jgi:hypothetical protein
MLTSNERFKKEYTSFSEKISSISDDRLKNELKQLLQQLVNEAKSIDRQHEELFRGSKLAIDSVSDHRQSITRIRQQLVKKIEDCEKAGLIKLNQSS